MFELRFSGTGAQDARVPEATLDSFNGGTHFSQESVLAGSAMQSLMTAPAPVNKLYHPQGGVVPHDPNSLSDIPHLPYHSGIPIATPPHIVVPPVTPPQFHPGGSVVEPPNRTDRFAIPPFPAFATLFGHNQEIPNWSQQIGQHDVATGVTGNTPGIASWISRITQWALPGGNGLIPHIPAIGALSAWWHTESVG